MHLPPIKSCYFLGFCQLRLSQTITFYLPTLYNPYSTIQVCELLSKTGGSIMAGPRDRSRHRDRERQNQYPMQNIQPSHRSPTADSSTVHGEDSYDDRNHGHPQSSGAHHLGRRMLRTCQEGLAGALRTCKERSAGASRACKEALAKHRLTTILTASVVCILFISGLWAFRDYRLDRSTGLAMGHGQSTITVYHSSTTYVTFTVHYQQFHGAKPVHHQAPIAVPSNPVATGEVPSRDLSHPHSVTSTSIPVSGLYLIPTSFPNEGWPQTQQDSHPSSRSASNTEVSQTLHGSPGLENLEPEAKLLLQSRKIGVPRNVFAGQADADTTSFTRWGVEVLYDLHRRSRRSIPFYKGWCIRHTCSPRKQLSSMCNTNKTISDSFRKQECEWCWPENQRKHQEIDNHCTGVSERALNAMLIICGIVLFCTLVIAIILATRMLRRRRRAKADRTLQKHATTASPLQEKTNNVPSHSFSPHGMSKTGRYSKAAKNKVNDSAIEKRSPSEAVGLTLWYKSVFAQSGKRSRIGSGNPDPGRSKLQKQRTKPLDQEIVIGGGNPHGSVRVLPPAPPAISSRVFSDIENMGQGRFLSGPGTNNNQYDPQMIPRRSSRPSRAVSSGSEKSPSEATHRRDAGAGLYSLQRLTERS